MHKISEELMNLLETDSENEENLPIEKKDELLERLESPKEVSPITLEYHKEEIENDSFCIASNNNVQYSKNKEITHYFSSNVEPSTLTNNQECNKIQLNEGNKQYFCLSQFSSDNQNTCDILKSACSKQSYAGALKTADSAHNNSKEETSCPTINEEINVDKHPFGNIGDMRASAGYRKAAEFERNIPRFFDEELLNLNYDMNVPFHPFEQDLDDEIYDPYYDIYRFDDLADSFLPYDYFAQVRKAKIANAMTEMPFQNSMSNSSKNLGRVDHHDSFMFVISPEPFLENQFSSNYEDNYNNMISNMESTSSCLDSYSILSIGQTEESSTSSRAVSNKLKRCGKPFENENPVFFDPLGSHDANKTSETRETYELDGTMGKNFELPTSVDSKNTLNFSSEVIAVSKNGDITEQAKHFPTPREEMEILNDNSGINSFNLEGLDDLSAPCESSVLLDVYNYNDKTNNSSEVACEKGVQMIDGKFTLTINTHLTSIIIEDLNNLPDYDSSYEFYKCLSNEVHSDIKCLSQQISMLLESLRF